MNSDRFSPRIHTISRVYLNSEFYYIGPNILVKFNSITDCHCFKNLYIHRIRNEFEGNNMSTPPCRPEAPNPDYLN